MQILLAVPTFETISPDTFKSLYNMSVGEHEVYFDFVRGYDCAAARNRIVDKALQGGYDYVMMVDHDIVVPEDALTHLLEGEPEVCTGYYAHRAHPFDGRTSACYLGHFNYDTQYTVDDISDLRNSGVNREKIKGGGMGCIVIKRSALQKLKFPYYRWVQYDTGGTLSEDLYFCSRCHDANVDIWLDTRVGCGHRFGYIQNV